jgi:hypothetical protein
VILAYFFLRHARGRPELVPLFRVIPSPWDSFAPMRRSRWLLGHTLHHATAATFGAPGDRQPAEGGKMDQAMRSYARGDEGFQSQQSDDGLSLVVVEEGVVVARTDWMRTPNGTEQRQYKVRRDDMGVDCEIRVWRDGCKPGPWQYVGRNPGSVDNAIHKARDLQAVTEAFISLYERTQLIEAK